MGVKCKIFTNLNLKKFELHQVSLLEAKETMICCWLLTDTRSSLDCSPNRIAIGFISNYRAYLLELVADFRTLVVCIKQCPLMWALCTPKRKQICGSGGSCSDFREKIFFKWFFLVFEKCNSVIFS